jgi:hypothetical protein
MKTLALTLVALLLSLVPVLTPCASEDGTLCNWDASARGNGLGTSFIALTDSIAIPYSRK